MCRLQVLCLQIHTLEGAVEDSRQAQHRAGQEHQHAVLALQAQLKNAFGEMDVLRAGAGHAKDEALSVLKVCYCLTVAVHLPQATTTAIKT